MAQFPVKRTQHRPRREDRKARELADLKRAQHQLEAERDRLTQALAKSTRPRKERAPKPPKEGTSGICPDCGGKTQVIDLGRMKMWACGGCKWHQKIDEGTSRREP